MSDTTTIIALVETMPDHLRESHRAAQNWGTFPRNGAERDYMTLEDAQAIVDEDLDGYSEIVQTYKVRLEPGYDLATVWAFDSVAGHYTRHHKLGESELAHIRAAAGFRTHIPHRIGRDEDGDALFALPEAHEPGGHCYLNEDGLVVVPAGEIYDVRPA